MTYISSRKNLLAILAVLAVTVGLVMLGSGSAQANGKGKVIAVTGIATIDSEPVIVHVISVVKPGQSEHAAGIAALQSQGARALTKSEFSTLSNKWDQATPNSAVQVAMNYDGADEPNTADSIKGEIEAAMGTWNAVGSNFSFDPVLGSDGLACPSLVKECKGKQFFDQQNDIAWVDLRESTTLAVTWSGTQSDEADMAFNTDHSWSTDGTAPYDIQTVALHELGHVAGIGHSTEDGAIMLPTYQTIQHTLDDDDKAALLYLYDGGPAYDDGSGGGDPGGDPGSGTPDAIFLGLEGIVDGVDYSNTGRRGRDLLITVTITDGAVGVEGVDVAIAVDDASGGSYGTGTGTTNGSGEVSWRIRNGSNKAWSTTVTSATLGSLTCNECGISFPYAP